MVYGKDAKTNKLCDQIDIYNFENVFYRILIIELFEIN